MTSSGKYFFQQVNTIHLFPLHKGDMGYFLPFPFIREIWRFVHPRKVIFPEGNARGKYDYFEGEKIFVSPLCKGNKCVIPPGQRFGEFCEMRSFGHLCLQNYYFGTSLELIPLYDQSVKSWEFQIREIRYCWEGNTMLLREKDDVLINVTWDCFDQSNFYICRINIIEWNNIHLLHAGEGNIIQLLSFDEVNVWIYWLLKTNDIHWARKVTRDIYRGEY
jgi:hypothetical protein